MTKDEQINFIREKCIEANPEIVELKFGCEVEIPYAMEEWWSGPFIVFGETWVCNKHKRFREECMAEEDGCTGEDGVMVISGDEEAWTEIKLKATELKTILGRPIRLADVLLAIDHETDEGIAITRQGRFLQLEDSGWRTQLNGLHGWNLRNDNLTEQSDETVDFIYQLLAK